MSVKLLFLFSTALIVAGCSSQRNDEIFIRPMTAMDYDSSYTINTIRPDNSIYFTDAFWQYFTEQFTSAGIEFFRLNALRYPIQLQDSSYSFAIISDENREYLLTCLPQNLSENEKDHYWELPPIGSWHQRGIDAVAQKKEVYPKRWKPAAAEVAEDYARFYHLISDTTTDHLLVFKKTFRDMVLSKIKTAAPQPASIHD